MQLPAADRTLLFWTACLPARYLFAAVAAPRFPTSTRTLAAFVGARWVLNDNFTSPVGFFGGRAWWSSMRPWHGALARLCDDGRARRALRRCPPRDARVAAPRLPRLSSLE